VTADLSGSELAAGIRAAVAAAAAQLLLLRHTVASARG
jgi:hypothetical protein